MVAEQLSAGAMTGLYDFGDGSMGIQWLDTLKRKKGHSNQGITIIERLYGNPRFLGKGDVK